MARHGDDCSHKCTVFGCCLGAIFFAIAGGLRLATKHAFGTCWVNGPGSCTRSCDDRLVHCNFSPLYANTSFLDGNVARVCEWQTSHKFPTNFTCQAALKDVGFSGNCVQYAGLCADPSYVPTSMAVASFFLAISGCCMLFFVWGCYAMFHKSKPDRQHALLLATRVQT